MQPNRWWKPPFTLDLVWALLPFALVALGFGLLPLKSWDYWWHIAFGRMIAATHEAPHHAHWLYTMPADASSWVQPWLSQWVLFKIHDTFGLHGVLLLRNALATFAFGGLGLWAARRAQSQMTGAILTLFLSAFGFFTIAARSHLIAWPLFFVIVPVAYALRAGRVPSAALVVFPLVTGLWSNLHGTFPVPLVIAAAFAGAEFVDRLRGGATHVARGPSWKLWAATTVASVAATGLNPRGFEVWDYLLLMAANRELRETVTEWWPTTPWSPEVFGALFYVMLLGGLALMWRQRARLDYADLFMVLWTALLTIPQARFMLWFCLAFGIAVAPYLRRAQPTPTEQPSTASQAVNVVIVASLLLVALAVQPWGDANRFAAALQAAPARTSPPDLGLAQADAPYDAIPLIQAHFDKTPRLFHDHRNAGFLLFHLDVQPYEQVVFLDNRVELPPYSDWRRFDAIGRGENAEAELDELKVEAVVTSYHAHEGLIDVLKDSPHWTCPVDRDGYVLCWRATR